MPLRQIPGPPSRRSVSPGTAAVPVGTASVVLPAVVSGVFRVRLRIFLLAALTAGTALTALYIGIPYFLGPEIAERIGTAGTKAVIGIALVVAIGLGVRACLSKWRANRGRPPE